MATIKVRVQGEIAKNITPEVKLVCQNDQYDVEFEFDESWENSNVKTALFIYNGKVLPVVFDRELDKNVCKIPTLFDTELLHIGVKSDDYVGLHTSTPAKVGCLLSANDMASGEITAPTKEVYDQIIALLNQYITSGGGGGTGSGGLTEEQVKQIVTETAVTQENDPTVPAWAKQPEKPTYTAQEVGALSQGELQSGVNQALQQAKQSGEFDGKDYVLTEEDKQEIAEEASKLVETPSVDLQPLTFTGAVEATYDGKTPVTVKIPTGGAGGETEWTKKTITLSEPVSTIAINIPQAKRVLIYAYLVINDLEDSLNTGSSLFTVFVNGYNAGYFSEYIRSGSIYGRLIDIEKVLSKTKLLATSSFDNGFKYSQSKGLACYGCGQTDIDASETINEIAFVLADTKYVFPTRCSLEVYYK